MPTIFFSLISLLLFLGNVQACLNDTYCSDCSPIPLGFDSFGNLYIMFVCYECSSNRQLNEENQCICNNQYYINENDECTACPQKSHLNSQRQCICDDGFYQNVNSDCQVCPDYCETCSSSRCLSCAQSDKRQLEAGECICIEGYQQQKGSSICSEKPNILMIALSTAGSVVCFFGSVILCACIRLRRRGQQVFDNKKKRNSQNIEIEIYDSYEYSGAMQNTSNMFWNNKTYEFSQNQPCSICLETGTYFMTQCGHYFHAPCIYNWLEKRSTCPNCNKQISAKEIRRWCEKCHKVLMPVIRNVVIKKIGKNGKKKKELVQSTPIEHQYCEECDLATSSEQDSQSRSEQSAK